MTVWIKPVVHDCAFAADDTVRVDVMFNSIDRTIDQASLRINFMFPQSTLDFVRAERGDLVSTWSTFDVSYDGTYITINGSSAAPIATGISGAFARIVYAVKTCEFDSNVWVCPGSPGLDIAGVATVCEVVHVVPAEPGSLTVESISHTCGDPVAGDTVEVDVRVENAPGPIDAAGLDVTFDPQHMEYVGYRRGDLTSAWPFFDAAELVNVIRVGGFTQAPIAGGSSGAFVTLRFVVHCCNGLSIDDVCTSAPVDDFAAMSTGCGDVRCVPLATRPSTWGYVKSLYR